MVRDSRALGVLAVPLILTQLAQVALTTTDTVMTGLLGTSAFAAGGLAVVIFHQVRTMGVGLLTAMGNQTAAAVALGERATREGHRAGEPGQEEAAADGEVRSVVRAGLAVATFAGIVGALLMILFGQCLTLLGQDEEVVALTRSMLLTLAPGLLPCLWFQAVRQFTVGMRRPRALLPIAVASIAVNAGLDWILVNGSFGLPRLGLVGVGAATSGVYLLSFLALRFSVSRDKELARFLALDITRADPVALRRLVVLGIPIAAAYGSEAGFFSLTTLMAGSFGPDALAAHTAANQLVHIVFQVSVGFSHAASISVSRELALGNHDGARRLRNAALACSSVVMALVAGLYLMLPGAVLAPLLGTGTGTGQALTIATQLLTVTAFLQFFDCAQNIGTGLLRGLGETKSGFLITLVGYWAVGLPVAWLAAHLLGLGLLGVWLGLLTGLATTAGLLIRRYNRWLAHHEGNNGTARPV
ncbi:MATE family efflux transporter [Streptomyces sp. NPDC059917]|uniref:MATE family efflux transporter n=1 Tax=Streptomyces sp. NPDC059917 TaxID=3347002 RepID=UPI00366884FD